MARLARVTQKIFAGSAANNGVFGSAQIGTKVLSNDLSTIMGLAAWASGWLSAVLGSSKFPPLEEFQSVSYVHSAQIAYLLQQGIAEYDAGSTYYTNNLCINPGTVQLFESLTDNNTGNALSSAANWKLLVDFATIGAGNPIYIGGTSTGSANAQVLATLTPTGFALTNGFTVTFTAGFTNTGGTTMNANSTGATPIRKNSGAGPAVLTGGEIVAGNTISLTYSSAGGYYVITNSGGLLASNNLSDVQSASVSLQNLSGVPTSRTISPGGIVTGGGDLSANRTITVTAAVKADQTTASSTTKPVVPAVQQYHPSATKGWVNFAGSTGVISASYNVTSITRNGAGDYTVNFTNPFTNGSYAPSFACAEVGTTIDFGTNIDSTHPPTASTCRFIVQNGNTGTRTDVSIVTASFNGTQ